MTKEIDQKLDNLLDINSDIKQETRLVKLPDRDKNIESDYRYIRENLYDLVERGRGGPYRRHIRTIKETEHPRAYEVAGQLIKTVSETAEKVNRHTKKLKDLEKEDSSVKTQHNHLYVGSTSELQKFLKKESKKTVNKFNLTNTTQYRYPKSQKENHFWF